jgi:pimeloyl-ACP methyl ester carboxylesterase
MPIERGLARTSAGYIHYRTAGSGQPVMLFHINQQSSALMIELITALAPHCRPIAIDYPSHGDSDHIAQQPSINDYARWTTEVMDTLGVDRAVAMGEAMGAAVATALAGDFPDRVDKVVLMNCPFSTEPGRLGAHARELQEGLRPADATGFPLTRTLDFVLAKDARAAPLHPTQSWMDRSNQAQIEAGRDRWQAMTALAAFDVAAALRRIACPTLLLSGEFFYYDKYRPDVLGLVPDIRAEVVPGGRFGMSWEHAETIAARTVAFLGSPT